MIEGMLTINLDPPYLQFHGDDAGVDGCLRECTTEEIRAALSEFGDIRAMQSPLDDCVIRLHGKFPTAILSRFGLLRGLLAALPEHLLLRIAN